MATDEWVKRAITGGKQYEDLPSRVRSLLSASEYKSRSALVSYSQTMTNKHTCKELRCSNLQGEGALHPPRLQLDRKPGQHQLSGAGIL